MLSGRKAEYHRCIIVGVAVSGSNQKAVKSSRAFLATMSISRSFRMTSKDPS